MNTPSNFKISVIIPSYNQARFLERTILSLLAQEDFNLEILLIDGGSTDGSLEIIKRYEEFLTFWRSCKDNGQSEAINFGFQKATGVFKVWLNSDDLILPGALKNLRIAAAKHPTCRWFAGSTLWINKDDKIIRVGRQENPGRLFKSKKLAQASPSSFLRNDLLDQFGLLREDMHYTMDTEMWYRLINGGEMFQRIPGYTWALRLHEAAKMSGHNFANSPLADPSHPSFVQKHKESEILKMIEPGKGRFSLLCFYLNKLFDQSIVSRVTDRKLLGCNVNEVFK